MKEYQTKKKRIISIILSLCATVSVNAHSDETIIATTLILEAGGEYAEGSMEAINEVICNRSSIRNLTRREVCLQKSQFSCWNSGKVDALIAKAQRHPRYSQAIAIINENITNFAGGADHYHAEHCSPYWASRMHVTAKIGRHVFRLNRT